VTKSDCGLLAGDTGTAGKARSWDGNIDRLR
jgi:hypothetical protein